MIEWYHTGAIFKKRTILPNGIGVGDKYKGSGNNAEAIVPLDQMYRRIESIVKSDGGRGGSKNQPNANVTVNIYSPENVSASDAAYETKRILRELAFGL